MTQHSYLVKIPSYIPQRSLLYTSERPPYSPQRTYTTKPRVPTPVISKGPTYTPQRMIPSTLCHPYSSQNSHCSPQESLCSQITEAFLLTPECHPYTPQEALPNNPRGPSHTHHQAPRHTSYCPPSHVIESSLHSSDAQPTKLKETSLRRQCDLSTHLRKSSLLTS